MSRFSSDDLEALCCRGIEEVLEVREPHSLRGSRTTTVRLTLRLGVGADDGGVDGSK